MTSRRPVALCSSRMTRPTRHRDDPPRVTLSELLAERVRVSPNGEAYRQFDAARGEWIGPFSAEGDRRVAHWRAAVRAEGLPAGARVAVLVPNSLEHVCVDQAALAEGLVPVPL